MSINLGPLVGGKHKCELNNATNEKEFANNLVNKPAFTYLAIEVMPCKRLSFNYNQLESPQWTVFTVQILAFLACLSF